MKHLAFLLTLFVCLSCSKKEDDSNIREAQVLFQETVTLISDYITKIQNTKDSSEIVNLMVELDKKLTDINFSYPSNTDFNLSEQDNDSIFKLMKLLKELRQEKLKDFSSPNSGLEFPSQNPDSTVLIPNHASSGSGRTGSTT